MTDSEWGLWMRWLAVASRYPCGRQHGHSFSTLRRPFDVDALWYMASAGHQGGAKAWAECQTLLGRMAKGVNDVG